MGRGGVPTGTPHTASDDIMPRLTRWFLKAGLVYLVAAAALGGLLMAQSLLSLPGWVLLLRPVYLHLIMVGWIDRKSVG